VRAPAVWGATTDDWTHFDLLLGLGADLLPVVSNPGAVVAAGSKLRGLGKTPSRYNRARQVVGIPGWTSYQASDGELARWAAEPDYGICLQTRSVRALDIDVPDEARARAITDLIDGYLDLALPARCRADSGKVLLAFTLPGDLAKRTMRVDGGIIEFLATGQQFIAAGTHPAGLRYEWAGGLPDCFPVLALETFEGLWWALTEQFAVEAPTGGAVSVRQRGEHRDLPDPVADLLHAQGRVLDVDRDGALAIACPWVEEHTTGEDGDGSTVWFPAGSNGHAKGHFKCLHGHCEGRSDGDFFAAVGYVEDVSGEFDVVDPEAPAEAPRAPLPAFKRDKAGGILATLENVALAARRADLCGMDIRHDTFRDEIMFATTGDDWRPFRDADYSRLRIRLERAGFKPIGREMIRDVVLLVAEERPFDSAIAWLEGLKWDGQARVDGFLRDYFGADDSEYVRAVSRYLWSALAGRVLSPGVKADMAPILVGEQGAAKSSSVAAMVPDPDFFTEVSFGERDDDLARKMRGRLLAEISELRGLRSREVESIKAFISRTHEHWVPKYREFATTFPRRLVFVGTTNKDEFLADETGNRRWLPVRVSRADVEAVKRDRLQLWAEGRELFRRGGIAYQAAEELAEPVHKEHMITDPWAEEIARWLGEPDTLTGACPGARSFLRVGEVAREALRLEAKQISKGEEMRICNSLQELGYTRKKQRVGGPPVWVWVRK
jgi:hypothetical protein